MIQFSTLLSFILTCTLYFSTQAQNYKEIYLDFERNLDMEGDQIFFVDEECQIFERAEELQYVMKDAFPVELQNFSNEEIFDLLASDLAVKLHISGFLKSYTCSKSKTEKALSIHQSFIKLFAEVQKELNLSDTIIFSKILEMEKLLNEYISFSKNEVKRWEKQLKLIQNEKIIDTSLLCCYRDTLTNGVWRRIVYNYTTLSVQVGSFFWEHDFLHTLEKYKNQLEIKKTLNAEIISSDLMGGDGIYLVKIKEKKWGLFNILNSESKILVAPEYDSIGKIGWNDPYIKVWKNGKVGLHSLYSEKDHLLVSCLYDEIVIGNVLDENSFHIGKYCAVRLKNKWGFVDWNNGEIIINTELDNYRDIGSFKKVARD